MLSGFLAVLLIQCAYAIRPEQLEIRVNVGFKNKPKIVSLGSNVQIAGLRRWSNEELVDLAFVAHEAAAKAHGTFLQELAVDGNPLGLSKKKPTVTAVLQVDNTAYIATSLIGGSPHYDKQVRENGQFKHQDLGTQNMLHPDKNHPCNAVHQALERCQSFQMSNYGHKNGGCCAEQTAALAFCSTNSQQSLAGARIVAIASTRKGDRTFIIPPCVNPENQLPYEGAWGCHDFTSQIGLGLNVIPENTRRGTLPEVADADKAVTWAIFQ